MSSLYELSNHFQNLLNADNEDFTQDLAQAEYDLREKMIDCIKYAKSLHADAMAIKEAVEAMNDRRVKMEKRAAQMRDYVLENMQVTDIKNIECTYFKISRRLNPPSVLITDEDLIPSEFKRIKTIVEIDKTAIKSAGGCNGAIISQSESLRIS